MKVLIIDDEPLVRRSLARALKSRDHETIEAGDGLQGLAAWKAEKPDLIFLDVLMPGMNGPEVLREMIQEVGVDKLGKVILISAFSGEHNMETAQQMGANLFIPKPFENIFEVVTMAEDLMR
jgi:CheY-like chemotaxis protein